MEFSVATFQLLRQAVFNCSKEPRDQLRLVPHIMANFGAVLNARDGLKYCTKNIRDQIREIEGISVDPRIFMMNGSQKN